MKRILIIDDEELALSLLKKILEGEGYEVVEALDGQHGIDLFQEKPADLVITDIVMPVKDGLSTIMELREIDKNLPVIAISGGGSIAKERYLTVASYLNVLTIPKPFTRTQIVEAVHQLLD